MSEIKPFVARIPIDEYINSGHQLAIGDSLYINSIEEVCTIHEIYPEFKTAIVRTKSNDIRAFKLVDKNGDYAEFDVVKICVLRSELSSIKTVEQLNLFGNG